MVAHIRMVVHTWMVVHTRMVVHTSIVVPRFNAFCPLNPIFKLVDLAPLAVIQGWLLI